MAVIRPPANLPGEAMPWSRQVERELDDLGGSTARALQDALNANQSLQASVNLLSKQVQDLIGRRSYANSNSSNLGWAYPGTIPAYTNLAVPVTITLKERRQVLVRGSAKSTLTVNSLAADSVSNIIYLMLNNVSTGRSDQHFLAKGSTSFQLNANSLLVAEATFVLDAGTYEFNLSGFGGGSTSGGAGNITNPSLLVQILEPA